MTRGTVIDRLLKGRNGAIAVTDPSKAIRIVVIEIAIVIVTKGADEAIL